MARDMTVRELRQLLAGVPDHWPVMMMTTDDDGQSWDCLPTSVARSHVDPNQGCEGVWLYNLTDDSENPPVDWVTEYGVPEKAEGESDESYWDVVNVWEQAHTEWHKVVPRSEVAE